jgi:hypothetical protein
MTQRTFLTLVSLIALSVGTFAVIAPADLLASKGVAPSEAGNLWARELGVALVGLSVATFLCRSHAPSPTLRAFLIGNAILQVGLFPIEILAYQRGIITNAAGIVPNSILHVLLAAGFVYFASRAPRRETASVG